jgi:hypothetical protein
MVHGIVNYIATKKEEQNQVIQRIKQTQNRNKLKQEQQLEEFQKHNLARKQHQQQVQANHLKQRDDRQKQMLSIKAPVKATIDPPVKEFTLNTEIEPSKQIEIKNQVEEVDLRKMYFDKTKNYYVCSYGGCGSKILVEYLSNFGNVYHIHSRNPPKKLQYIGNINTVHNVTTKHQYEWFNTKEIREEELKNYTVIYIYRNPIKAIYSRFLSPAHLQNIQCADTTIKLQDIIDSAKDLYGIEDFFDNYTNNKEERNYKIYSVKYEDFFDNISYFNSIFELPDDTQIYPKKIESVRKMSPQHYLLEVIYSNLICKMNKMNFIV